ncbi:MAG TPA: AMP-binding protein, partial [Alphaproteobacteria bacterium]|nr:AMP-binding protein [Alphaproteobacteria bacterium]
MSNLYAEFEQRFPKDEDATFIETGQGRIYSYGDLARTTARYAGLLRARGVGKGDRVAVQVGKSPEAIFLYLACLRAGAVFLPMNTAYQRGEVDYIVGDAEPALVVCAPEREAEMQAIAAERKVPHVLTLGTAQDGSFIEAAAGEDERFETTAVDAAEDIAAILYTSGTTGRPKGAMLSHRNLSSNTQALYEVWQFRAGDVLLHALPIFHAHGLFVATNTQLWNGGP